MKLNYAIFFGLMTLAVTSAKANQDSDAITRFGLAGHWAARCQEQPGPKNVHQFFIASPIGSPIWQTAGGDPPSGLYLVSNVHALGPDQIAFTTTINGVLYNFMITKSGNKRRTMDVVSASGQAIVRNGIVMATGAETNWSERCSN